MSLSETIQKDIVTAMKAKDEMKLSVLRMAKAAFQLKEVDKMRKLDEQESIQLLQTLVKQRKESIDQFGKGGRQDLVDKEQERSGPAKRRSIATAALVGRDSPRRRADST